MTAGPTETRPSTFLALPDDVRAFLDAERFATIATLDPDGAPRQAVVWYALDRDEIVLNSAVGRRWPSNLLRDPRCSFAAIDAAYGYRWIGLTGLVSVIDDQPTAQADIARMCRRYLADDPPVMERRLRAYERQTRISFRLRALRVTTHVD